MNVEHTYPDADLAIPERGPDHELYVLHILKQLSPGRPHSLSGHRSVVLCNRASPKGRLHARNYMETECPLKPVSLFFQWRIKWPMELVTLPEWSALELTSLNS